MFYQSSRETVSTVRLEAPEEYHEADPAEVDEVVNGCGPESVSFLVPDSILGVDISGACRVHDWEYHEGRRPRKEIDTRFLRNMLILIDARGGIMRHIRRIIARWYWRSVKNAGEVFYDQDET